MSVFDTATPKLVPAAASLPTVDEDCPLAITEPAPPVEPVDFQEFMNLRADEMRVYTWTTIGDRLDQLKLADIGGPTSRCDAVADAPAVLEDKDDDTPLSGEWLRDRWNQL